MAELVAVAVADVTAEMRTLIWSLFTTVADVFVPDPAMAAVELKPVGFVSMRKYVSGVSVEKLNVPVESVMTVDPTCRSVPESNEPFLFVSRNSLT